MSVATEIARIQTDRNTIRNKLIDFVLAESTSNLDALATAVDGIVNCGAVSAQVQEGDTYTIPKGYHNGAGTVSGRCRRRQLHPAEQNGDADQKNSRPSRRIPATMACRM